jgi:ribosome-associated heat shock protein Hsp15
MTEAPRQRVDVWLYRARLTKTRAAATRLITEGGVRIAREGQTRRLQKASTEVSVGDVLVAPFSGQVRAIRVLGIGARRGPASEARALYAELDAEPLA